MYAPTHYELGNDDRPRSPHSSIIALGVEEGLIGLALYLWLLFAIYTQAARQFRTAQVAVEKALLFGAMSATVCLFLLDMTGTRFFSGEIMAYYWMLIGMALNINLASEATFARAARYKVVG
jgi:O-antigen ligase